MTTKHISLIALTAAAVAFGAEAQDLSGLDGLKVRNLKVERAASDLNISFDLLLDDIKLGSNEQVTYRPIVVSESGDTAVFRPVVLNGRNQQLKIERNPNRATAGAIEMRRHNGTAQTVNYTSSVPYADWMSYSDIQLKEDLCGCGNLKEQDDMPLATIDNRPAPAPAMVYITPAAEAVKDRSESGQAFVDFVVNKTVIQPEYRGNRKEIAKIVNTIDLVKDDPFVTITNINIHGFASPEGSYDNNVRLASGRAAALKDYVASLYTIPASVFTSNYTPEDWGNLRKYVAESNLPEKEELLAIIDSDMQPDPKDHEMRRLYPRAYDYMYKNWYPALRHSDYTVNYVVRPLTIEEAKQVLVTNPKNLSLNEMFLVAQTYTPGSDEFNNVFETAVKVFPDDPTANLNAAVTALNKDDVKAAEGYLLKAGNEPEAIHARGILAMKQGRFAEARHYLTQAAKAGIKEAEGNLVILDRNERLASGSVLVK